MKIGHSNRINHSHKIGHSLKIGHSHKIDHSLKTDNLKIYHNHCSQLTIMNWEAVRS